MPDECMGDVIGDLNSRRGKVVGMETKGHTQVIKSQSADGGGAKVCRRSALHHQRAWRVSMEFSHYEELPAHLAEKVIKEAKARKMAEHEGEH